MAKKDRRTWLPSPSRAKKPSVPETLKAQVSVKAEKFVESVLKPKFVEPPPKKPRFNYIIDVAAKWHASSMYLVLTYACLGPTAISPTFEHRFARVEFVGNDQFSVSFISRCEVQRQLHIDSTNGLRIIFFNSQHSPKSMFLSIRVPDLSRGWTIGTSSIGPPKT
jgi:hypothetical protein